MSLARGLPAIGLAFLLALAGCKARPRAPMLDNGPVFTNKEVGIRFLVPVGWSQEMLSVLPPGKIEGEQTLALYRSYNPVPASMDVSIREIPEDVDIGEALAKRKRTGSGWTRFGPVESVEYGGKKGTRYYLKGKPGDVPTTCETVAFRQGGRVIFFGGFYPPGDTLRRSQVRQFLEGLTWTKP